MDLQLQGKSALITGGSLGIGKASAMELAREGCDVAIAARREDVLKATAEEIASATGRKIVPIVTDTSKSEDITRMVETAKRELGRLDILVNSAAQVGGGGRNDTLLNGDESLFFDDFNTKMMGYVRSAREAARIMVEQGWGRIILVSGLATRQTAGVSGGMRNAAVTNLGAVLAQELGQHGINVNTIQPGGVLTEALPERTARQAQARGVSADEMIAQMSQSNAIRHLVTAEEIGQVVAFLASPLSVAITGESISVGGGGRMVSY